MHSASDSFCNHRCGTFGFLVAFDFTVANGTILYAFVIKSNAYLFFSPSCNPVMKILSVFIAWLNLDLGIETCFYEEVMLLIT